MDKHTDIKKKIKVLLVDPRHNSVGAHSNYIPIGIGYIGAYIKKSFEHISLELKLETDAEKIFTLIDIWKPDIVGSSNYIWNSSLSNFICEYAKKQNPNILCVLGGPEFPAGTGQRKIENNLENKTYDKCLKYLIKRPAVDYYTYTDGENALVQVLKKFLESNLSLKLMKDKNEPIGGCASLSRNKDKLLVGEYLLRIGTDGPLKNERRDIIPSPYTSGLLDKFLDGKFVPAFETAKGCPFTCTFCDQGLDHTKITAFSVNRLAEEMLYVAKKLSHLKRGTKAISFFDSNWGIFEKDVRLADHILKLMQKYDWPKFIECSTPKSNWNNIIKINDKLKNRVGFTLSTQSLQVKTLNDIKRKSWTLEQYINFVNEAKKRGKVSGCELIVPLPNETEETYYDGVKFLMNNNVEARTYTLMMLCGAELGRDAAIKKFGLKSKFRILPKQFGEYREKRIFEIERICVGTNTMSFHSYLNCRNYSFIVRLLGHPVFLPVYKLTQKLGISWYDFSKTITNIIQDKNFNGKFKELYNDFCKESHKELFDSMEEADAYYSTPKNYKLLLSGEAGESLASKYTVKGLLILDEILTTIFYVIRNKFNKSYNVKLKSVLNSTEKWLKKYILDRRNIQT